MSNNYGVTGLIGGGAGDLDNIDGTNLASGDAAFVVTSTAAYFFYMNATSAASEVSPFIISPDANAGNKRWILIGIIGAGAIFELLKLYDTDKTHTLSLKWNEDDSSDRVLNIKVNSGSRTLDLSEDLTLANGYNFTITIEDANGALVLDNVNFEVENTDGTQRNIKITSAVAGNTTLTLSGNATLGDWFDQAVKQASSPTLANLTLSKTLKTHQGSDVAGTNDMTLGDGNFFDITGATTINTIASKGIGTFIVLQFDAALQLTHSSNLFLPTAANITTAAGDIAVFYEYASADWRCESYQRADGTPLVGLQEGDAINMADALLTRPEIKDYSETPHAEPSSSNIITLDFEDGGVFTTTLTENITTFNIASWLASKTKSLTWFLTQDSPARTVDFTNESIIWQNGNPPDLTTVSSKHVITIASPDGGTTKFGFHASKDAATP